MNHNGWVRLPRSLLDDIHYRDNATKCTYTHLLLVAEVQPRRVCGIDLKPGETLTTVKRLANETGFSVSQTRTALSHLQITNKIACKTTNKHTVVTLINTEFETQEAVEFDKQNNTPNEMTLARKSQTKTKRLRKSTLSKEKKEIKKEKEDNNQYDVDGDPAEMLEGELSDEEAARINANCKAMMTYIDDENVIKMLQYVDGVKDALGLTDCSEHLELCKLTKRYGWLHVRDAIEAAIEHTAQHPVAYIRKICEEGG